MVIKKILKVLLVADLAAVNAAAGYLLYKFSIFNFQISNNFPVTQFPNSKTEFVDRCGEECQSAIKAEVAQFTSLPVAQLSPTGTPKPTAKPATGAVVKKVRREETLTVPDSGSTSANDWANLAGTEFYFDTRDYPGLTEVYFEANMKLVDGNGRAYVRLYDITHGIAPSGGENDTTSQADVWTTSQKVYFWAGRNYIRVQAKSLTADTAVFNAGRLRIVTEN